MKCFNFLVTCVLFVNSIQLGYSLPTSRNHNATELMDLNLDVKLLILECLDLKDLVVITETNKHFSALAEDIFRRKYSKEIIGFIEPILLGAENMYHNKLPSGAKITDVSTAVHVLKRFGSSISRLLVSYSAYNYEYECRKLYKLINEYCSKTLTDITIDQADTFSGGRFFGDMTKAFSKVEKVTIRGYYNNLASSTLSFKHLFPALRYLSITFVTFIYTQINGLHQTFPKLEHLHVEMCQLNQLHFSESNTKSLLQQNPHIRNLTLVHSDRDFLKTVNEVVPKLKYLELRKFHSQSSFGYQEIRFENVKTFRIDNVIYGMPRSVTFPNLVEFYTEAAHGQGIRWIDFLERHSHVKRFYIENGQANGDELNRLTAIDDMNLIDTSLLLSSDISSEILANFVRKNKNCSRIHLTMVEEPHSLKLATQFLRQELTNNWTIKESEFEVTLKNRAVAMIEENDPELAEGNTTIFGKFVKFFTKLIE